MNEYELIESYLKGNLQGQALIDFEKQTCFEQYFCFKVEEHKAMQEMLITQGLIQIREKLQAFKKGKKWP